MNAARLNFTVAGGNVIFGGQQDAVVGTSGVGSGGVGKRVPGVISDRELARVVHTFVKPPVYPKLRQALSGRHLVVLRASRGWGRTAVAEHLLHDVLTAADPDGTSRARIRISRLGTDVEPGELGIADLTSSPDATAGTAGGATNPPGRGFLLDVGVLPNAETLRGSDLERLAHDLVAAGLYLVVTVDADVAFGDELEGFLHEGGPAPDTLELLAAHGARVLAIDRAQAGTAVAADPELELMARELQREGVRTEAVAALGERWARGCGAALMRGDPVEQAMRDDLRQWLKEQIDSQFVEWMTATEDLTHRAFVIALAVFNGMPYSKVTRLGRDLETRLRRALRPAGHLLDGREETSLSRGDLDDPTRENRRVPAGPPLFSGPRGPRLEAARAAVGIGVDETPYGDITVELVRLRTDGYAWKILNWLWHEQDGVHKVLVEWLSALGGDRDLLVRVRAAAAVGLLTSWGFDEMRSQVLLRWADLDRPSERSAVGIALGLAVHYEPSLLPVVTKMLRDWKWHTLVPQRRHAAVRAWGAGLGSADIGAALDQILWLIGLLETERVIDADAHDSVDYALIGEAAQSVLELFECPTHDATAIVVKALAEWTEKENPRRTRLMGLLGFLRIALHAKVTEGLDPDGRPTLLALSMPGRPTGPRTLRLVAVLWGRALAEPVTNEIALGCLREWAEYAELDGETSRTTLAHVVWESLETPADFRRMWRSFSFWEETCPHTSREVMAVIGRSVQEENHGPR